MAETGLRAVLWDFGGVILSSPFEAFNRYEDDRGLPRDFIRGVNSRDPHSNAWARLERSEISPAQFDVMFGDESEAAGHRTPGADVLALLAGEIRPEMVAALATVREHGYLTACLTNNVLIDREVPAALDALRAPSETGAAPSIGSVMSMFDVVVESSRAGVRKPEPRFYEIACEMLSVAPDECVFLDDLGINLKPAAAMGMRTIKVGDPRIALDELSRILGIEL